MKKIVSVLLGIVLIMCMFALSMEVFASEQALSSEQKIVDVCFRDMEELWDYGGTNVSWASSTKKFTQGKASYQCTLSSRASRELVFYVYRKGLDENPVDISGATLLQFDLWVPSDGYFDNINSSASVLVDDVANFRKWYGKAARVSQEATKEALYGLKAGWNHISMPLETMSTCKDAVAFRFALFSAGCKGYDVLYMDDFRFVNELANQTVVPKRNAVKDVLTATQEHTDQSTYEEFYNTYMAYHALEEESQALIPNWDDYMDDNWDFSSQLYYDRMENRTPETLRVDEMILALPSSSKITLKDKAAVQEARTAFNELEPNVKGFVFEKETLLKAEEAIHKLENPTGYNPPKNGWVKTLFGYRYYIDGEYIRDGWWYLNGSYYFQEDGHRVEGYYMVPDGTYEWYNFGDDGKRRDDEIIPDGFYTDKGGMSYVENGVAVNGIKEIDGKYYYFSEGYAQKNGTYFGRYFKDDYVAYSGISQIGDDLYLFDNGATVSKGAYEIDGAIYFADWGGILCTGDVYVSETYANDLLPQGTYTFGSDGKLADGVVETKEGLLLYINGTLASKGAYEIDDAIYFSDWNGKLFSDGRYYVSNIYANGLLDGGASYSFGADGKLLHGAYDIDGVPTLYINGSTASKGVFEMNGAIYYSDWGGKLNVDGTYYVSHLYNNGILEGGNTYNFDATGKLMDGAYNINGILTLYINGSTAPKGLFDVNGDIYYADWGGVLKADGEYHVTERYCNGLLEGGKNYAFGADGKLLHGIKEIDGALYYYIKGITASKGIYEINEAIYYADWGGKLNTNGAYYVSKTYGNGILEGGKNYTFTADGKMAEGIVEMNGKLFCYINGDTAPRNLYEIDGEIYCVDWGGLVKTSGNYAYTAMYIDNVAAWNNLVPEKGNYYFGKQGQMLHGFVEDGDTIRYFDNGRILPTGIVKIDGNFYHVESNGSLFKDGVLYVTADNGYTVDLPYVFDETGKIIGIFD